MSNPDCFTDFKWASSSKQTRVQRQKWSEGHFGSDTHNSLTLHQHQIPPLREKLRRQTTVISGWSRERGQSAEVSPKMSELKVIKSLEWWRHLLVMNQISQLLSLYWSLCFLCQIKSLRSKCQVQNWARDVSWRKGIWLESFTLFTSCFN